MTFKPESPKQEVMEHLCVGGWGVGVGGGQRGGGGVGHRDVLDCVISSSCFPRTLPHPLLPPPAPWLHNETNTKKQEVPPPLTGAQSKPSLFPCHNFYRKSLLRKYASCAGSVLLLSPRSSVSVQFFFSFVSYFISHC